MFRQNNHLVPGYGRKKCGHHFDFETDRGAVEMSAYRTNTALILRCLRVIFYICNLLISVFWILISSFEHEQSMIMCNFISCVTSLMCLILCQSDFTYIWWISDIWKYFVIKSAQSDSFMPLLKVFFRSEQQGWLWMNRLQLHLQIF